MNFFINRKFLEVIEGGLIYKMKLHFYNKIGTFWNFNKKGMGEAWEAGKNIVFNVRLCAI